MTTKDYMPGCFITFEGIDGAGKSTHVGACVDWLRAQGETVVLSREPGGSPLAERLRELLLTEEMQPQTEALLAFAARSDHLHTLIRPALAAGPALADAGATSMMDVSDGLLRDAGRIAQASGVVIDLDDPGDLPDMSFLEPVAALVTGGEGATARALARTWLLTGGEDHGMLATVPAAPSTPLPADVSVIGRVLDPQAPSARALGHRPGVLLGGEPVQERTGWDHFARA